MEISIGSCHVRLEIAILIVVVFWILAGHLLCSCCVTSPHDVLLRFISWLRWILSGGREGFVGANNTATGPEFATNQSPFYIMKPDTWAMPTLTYSPGTRPDAGIQSIWDRPKQPIPLPEGQLDMFASTQFKPECCPNAYSSSTGCACMTVDQYNYLANFRGGNNVPHSEY